MKQYLEKGQIYFWERPGTPRQTIMPTAIANGKATLAVVTHYPESSYGPAYQEPSELEFLESYLLEQGLMMLSEGEGLKGAQKRKAVEYAAAVRSEFCSLVFGEVAA